MKSFPKNRLAKYLVMALMALGSSAAFAQVSVSIGIAPPPLEVYDQPACPDDGYIWTPGYWAYDGNAYYWVQGSWVQPPEVGVYWTPPYWGWNDNNYQFHSGYWGDHVGYYGGINYGHGYGGHGYGGGRWQSGHFSYNTAVNNVSSNRVHYSYADRTAIHNNASKVSYNGGKGGVQSQPTAQQKQFSHAHSALPASAQPNAYKPTQVAAAKTSPGASPNPQAEAKKQNHEAQTHEAKQTAQETATHAMAPKPHETAAAPHQTSPASFAKTQPQTHPQPQVHTQPQTHARPQVHMQAQTHSQPQVHSQPQTHAQPQGNSDKSHGQ